MNPTLNLEAALQESQLALPLEVSMMPEVEPMGRWARVVHQMMYESNPWMMLKLHKEGRLIGYLNDQGEELSDQVLKLAKEWRLLNPLSQTAQHLERTAWLNQAKSYATEVQLNNLSEKIVSLRDQYQGTAVH
jgi:hypothetical protein